MPEGEESQEQRGPLKTVGVLLFRKNHDQVLLVKHGKKARNEEGIYGLPSGTIELGETPKETAVRELLEETGLNTTKNDLSHFEENFFAADLVRHDKDKIKDPIVRRAHWDVYICNDFTGELKTDVDDEAMPEWINISNVSKLNLMPNVELAIGNYLKTLNNE